MADSEKQPAPQPVTIALTAEQAGREQLAREMAALKDTPLDRTVPGGHFIGTDGEPHDAHGNRIAKGAAKSAAQSAAAPKDYEGMTVEDLEQEASGLTVEGTGANGRVLKADYVKALQKRDKAQG